MQLGQMIVKIRKESKLTQEEFAKKFDVTRQTVSNWENEKSYPDLLTLVKISDEFGYSLDTMLKENPKMTEQMNNEMETGKKLEKIYKNKTLKLLFAIIGVIACLTMWIVSLVNYDGILEPVIWLLCVLVCSNQIIEFVKLKKLKTE